MVDLWLIIILGMVGVALSRVRAMNTLQVLRFTRSVCVAPPDAVVAFLAGESADTEDDPNQCCRSVLFEDDLEDLIAALVCPLLGFITVKSIQVGFSCLGVQDLFTVL